MRTPTEKPVKIKNLPKVGDIFYDTAKEYTLLILPDEVSEERKGLNQTYQTFKVIELTEYMDVYYYTIILERYHSIDNFNDILNHYSYKTYKL